MESSSEENQEVWELPLGITPSELIGEIMTMWSSQPFGWGEELMYERDMKYIDWLSTLPAGMYRMPENIEEEIQRISELWENRRIPNDYLEKKFFERDTKYLSWLNKEKEKRDIQNAMNASTTEEVQVDPEYLQEIIDWPSTSGAQPIIINQRETSEDLDNLQEIIEQSSTSNVPKQLDTTEEVRVDLDNLQEIIEQSSMSEEVQVDLEQLEKIIDWPSTSGAQPIINQGESNNQSDQQQPSMPRVNLVAQRERRIRRFNTTGTEYIFAVDDSDLSMNDVYTIFEELVQFVLGEFNEDERVGIQLSLEGLDSVIYQPFTDKSQINAQRLLDLLEKVVQSNAKVSLKNIEMKVVRVKLSKGGKRSCKLPHSSLHQFLKRKRCIISVSGADDLCFGRCLALGICNHTSDKKDFTNLYHSQGRLTSEAKRLYLSAGVPLGSVGIKELQKFQVSQPKYQIVIYENDTIIFKGPKKEKQIFLLLVENHYYLIRSMTAFLCTEKFCQNCLKGYNYKNHKCVLTCRYCNSPSPCEKRDWKYCEECNRVFPSTACYDKHKNNGTCDKYVTCPDCYKIMQRARLNSHNCGFYKCENCKSTVRDDHKCFITRLQTEKKLTGPLIFFDCETTQELKNHRINLIVSRRMCCACVEKFSTSPCFNCEEKIFKNEKEFCEYLFTERNKTGVCLSHYGKGYDTQFIVRYLLENKKIPKVIATGTKFLSAEYKGIKLLDSYSFMPMKLSDLPKAFGFSESTKGFFPHLFNTKANEDYIGSPPAPEFYNVDGMAPATRDDFYRWYNGQRDGVFDMKAELKKYCKNDVDILVNAALRYRKIFFDISGVDPFTCVTLPQACLDVYRKNFMPEKAIGVFETRQDKYSHLSLKWLRSVEAERNISIQHALNGGEKKIGPYFVDGLHDMEVFSFQGCFFHGCPDCYKQRDVKPFKNSCTSHEENYQRTICRKLYFENLGYKVNEMWECQFKDCFSEAIIEPINARDALFGGRVEVFKTYFDSDQINYIDITSLYPFVNKTCYYPLGHPEIIKSNFSHITSYCGIAKCKILAPRDLYIPLLPVRINNKLLFPLCKTCAVQKTPDCRHSEDERAFIGTWCTPELNKALDLGYRIIEIYEVWHFKEGTNSLFENYVKTFLKIKQEASGWPQDCETEEARRAYIEKYLMHEQVSLDIDKIEKNPGLRSIAKLCLNSLWGKLGQRPDLPSVEFINDPEKFFSLFGNSNKIVKAVDIMTDDILKVTHQAKNESLSYRSNAIIAAFTTCHARLILYSYLGQLNKRVLYCDTDSVIYSGNPDIPLSPYLGGMTNEVPDGLKITKFIAVAPKSYGYQLSDGSSVLKVKGITLNCRNREVINLELLEKMVHREVEGAIVNDPYNIKRTKFCQIETTPLSKKFSYAYDKRQLINVCDTVPWGLQNN